jgi:aminoglycoside N3'-acetyltransferase
MWLSEEGEGGEDSSDGATNDAQVRLCTIKGLITLGNRKATQAEAISDGATDDAQVRLCSIRGMITFTIVKLRRLR